MNDKALTPKPPITRRVWPKEEEKKPSLFEHIIEKILIKESGSNEVGEFIEALMKGEDDANKWLESYFGTTLE